MRIYERQSSFPNSFYWGIEISPDSIPLCCSESFLSELPGLEIKSRFSHKIIKIAHWIFQSPKGERSAILLNFPDYIHTSAHAFHPLLKIPILFLRPPIRL